MSNYSWRLAQQYCPPSRPPVPNITACGWYLDSPEGVSKLMTGYKVNSDGSPGEAMAMRAVPLLDLFTRAPMFGGSINFKDTRKSNHGRRLRSAP